MNTGKSKVMVGSSGGKMIVNSGKWCMWEMYEKKWIHKRRSGVRGDLSHVADGFRCRRCNGTIQEADLGPNGGWRNI